MPPPMVNHSREEPSEQPTISLALLHQVGERPGAPGAAAISARCRGGWRRRRAAEECVAVVAQARTLRQALKPLRITAAEHYVVDLEGALQVRDDLADAL